jgi:hypothetical protein
LAIGSTAVREYVNEEHGSPGVSTNGFFLKNNLTLVIRLKGVENSCKFGRYYKMRSEWA